jgi:hypothetical protein
LKQDAEFIWLKTQSDAFQARCFSDSFGLISIFEIEFSGDFRATACCGGGSGFTAGFGRCGSFTALFGSETGIVAVKKQVADVNFEFVVGSTVGGWWVGKL